MLGVCGELVTLAVTGLRCEADALGLELVERLVLIVAEVERLGEGLWELEPEALVDPEIVAGPDKLGDRDCDGVTDCVALGVGVPEAVALTEQEPEGDPVSVILGDGSHD